MNIVAGSRGSKLALTQTDGVIQKLKQIVEDIEVSSKIIKTTGDKIADQHIFSISGEGAFEKEVNIAVAKGEIDFAVHSMKDLPIEYNNNITIAAVPKRESPYDTLVSNSGYDIKEIPEGTIVGTGSPRRKAQVRHLRPDLNIKSIRGDIDTRIMKLDEGLYDAIILAESGLNRLNINKKTKRLPPKDFPAAPGQGALAITIRKDRNDLMKMFNHINHFQSMVEISAERTFLSEIGGGCKVPIGALAMSKDNKLSMYAMILSFDGQKRFHSTFHGTPDNPEEVGMKVAEDIKKESGDLLKMVKHIE